jgi:tRNA-Thr(GGU) m(6)t(6)A37 methyltransferase TsaA
MTEKLDNKKESASDIEKLKHLMPYWISHNKEHIRDNERWLKKIVALGFKEVGHELRQAIEVLKKANKHIEMANEKLEQSEFPKQQLISETETPRKSSNEKNETKKTPGFHLGQIGIIRTPYSDNAPYQPLEKDEGDFRIVVDSQYVDSLYKLDGFRYIYVIYYVHRVKRDFSDVVTPPWAGGVKVGVFASRSPVRPNPIGISIVRIKGIRNNEIFTSGMDVFDGTPLLDIKPYIKDLDTKHDANYGWIEDMDDREHLLLHIRGIPHNY